MEFRHGNLFAALDLAASDEQVQRLLTAPGIRIERIVSTGRASPPGFWYDQCWDEFVLLVSGSAGVLFEGEAAARSLRPGDHLTIPARVRHRVQWTSASEPTIWLAIHCGPAGQRSA
jgi:cupin 2 domain-containing protein